MLDLPNVKENHIKSPSIVTLCNITKILDVLHKQTTNIKWLNSHPCLTKFRSVMGNPLIKNDTRYKTVSQIMHQS